MSDVKTISTQEAECLSDQINLLKINEINVERGIV